VGAVPGLLNGALPPGNAVPGPVRTPSAKVIQTGVINDRVYYWTFYSSGVVQVNNAYLSPRLNAFTGFLEDRTYVGLFQDGLHIGRHIVPYPAPYLPLIKGFTLPAAPPTLLSNPGDDDDVKR
jgi:hypothetical protein